MATYWNISSENGQSMSEGIQSEREARKAAQEFADDLGESVYLYLVGPGDGESEVESEEIVPDCAAARKVVDKAGERAVWEIACKVIDEAGQAGGLDEVLAIAAKGWPDHCALDVGDLDEAEVRAAIQQRAKDVAARVELSS